MTEARGIDPRLSGLTPTSQPKSVTGQQPGRRFEDLLEALERARVHGESPESGGADGISSLDASRIASSTAARTRDELAALDRDVATADDMHRDLLDLKQRLEGAFQQRLRS